MPPEIISTVFGSDWQTIGFAWLSFFVSYLAYPLAVFVALAITPDIVAIATDLLAPTITIGGHTYKKKDWEALVAKKTMDFASTRQARADAVGDVYEDDDTLTE